MPVDWFLMDWGVEVGVEQFGISLTFSYGNWLLCNHILLVKDPFEITHISGVMLS